MPTEAELNPNTRLIDNRFAAQIAENEALRKYVAEQGLSWDNDEDFIKMVLDLILSSEQYREYLNNEKRFIRDRQGILAHRIQKTDLLATKRSTTTYKIRVFIGTTISPSSKHLR